MMYNYSTLSTRSGRLAYPVRFARPIQYNTMQCNAMQYNAVLQTLYKTTWSSGNSISSKESSEITEGVVAVAVTVAVAFDETFDETFDVKVRCAGNVKGPPSARVGVERVKVVNGRCREAAATVFGKVFACGSSVRCGSFGALQ
jgi:hypothetical protein